MQHVDIRFSVNPIFIGIFLDWCENFDLCFLWVLLYGGDILCNCVAIMLISLYVFCEYFTSLTTLLRYFVFLAYKKEQIQQEILL